MLKTYALALGAYQTNCYIIHDEASKGCCVIDPGYDADIILDKLDSLGLSLEAILLTHGHFDHVGAVKELAAETGCEVCIPGSVCLLCETSIFSGDTLFQGSCGRTDLPGGDWATITKSLKRLAAIEGNFWVFPGHGGSTTLRDEKKYNPYMR